MSKMTIGEAIKMRGTEFTYIFSDGDTVPAFVKEFIPEKGLSCHSLASCTHDGYDFPGAPKEEDGSVCVIGYNFTLEQDTNKMPDVLSTLEEIRDTGCYRERPNFGLAPRCAFS